MIHAPVGIDVSLASLSVAALQVSGQVIEFEVPNTSEGFNRLLEELRRLLPDAALSFCMEATGTYHRALARFLASQGYLAVVLQPWRARELARGMGILRKNDRIDAQVLARAMALCPAQAHPLRTALHERLQDISRRIDSLTRERTAEKVRSKNPSLAAECAESFARKIAFLNQEIQLLEGQWRTLVELDQQFSKDYALLRSIFGVGHITARVVLSELPPQLPQAGRKKLAAYAGLAPQENTSGTSVRKKARICGGNKRLRTALYNAAATLILHHTECREIYETTRDKGKNHPAGLITVAAKLGRQISAVLKRQTPWAPEAP